MDEERVIDIENPLEVDWWMVGKEVTGETMMLLVHVGESMQSFLFNREQGKRLIDQLRNAGCSD